MRLALVLMAVEVEGAVLVSRIRTYQSHSRTSPNKSLEKRRENGWAAFHEMRKVIDEGTDKCFKIANLQPRVKQSMDRMGMLDIINVFDDLETALASF